jgi:hypothetical protein
VQPTRPLLVLAALTFGAELAGAQEGRDADADAACEQTLHASTAGLKPGSCHQLIELLADKLHAPLMPAVADSVEVSLQ